MDDYRDHSPELSSTAEESFSRIRWSVPSSGNTTPVQPSLPVQSLQTSTEASQRVGEQLRELRNAWSGEYRNQVEQVPHTQGCNKSSSRITRTTPLYDPATPPTQGDRDLQAHVQKMWQNIDLRRDLEMHRDMEIHAVARTRPAPNVETESSGSDLSSRGATTPQPLNPESLAQGIESPGDSTARDLERQSQNSSSVVSLPSLSSSLATTPSDTSARSPPLPPVIEPLSMPSPLLNISDWRFPTTPNVPAGHHESGRGSIIGDRNRPLPSPQPQNDEFQTALAAVMPSLHVPFQNARSHPSTSARSPIAYCRRRSDPTPLRSMPRDRQQLRSTNSPRRPQYRRHTMPSLHYVARSSTPPPQYTRYRRSSQNGVSASSTSPPPRYTRHRRSSNIYRPLSPRTISRVLPPGLVLRFPNLPRLGALLRSLREEYWSTRSQGLRTDIVMIQRSLTIIMRQIEMLLVDQGVHK